MHRCPWCGEPCDCDETERPVMLADCVHDCAGDDDDDTDDLDEGDEEWDT